MGYRIGVDIGGTTITIVVIDEKGKVFAQRKLLTGAHRSPNSIISEITREIKSILKNFKGIKAIGVGIAGDIDSENGVVRFSPNLLRWKNIPLRKKLRDKINLPIIVENDASASAWGTYILEAKRKAKVLLCVTLGTGIGGGIIIDGKIFKGFTGTAGEIGHTTINPEGPKCNCGNYGCLEMYFGKKAIIKMVIGGIKGGKKTVITKLVNNELNKITPRILQVAAEKGDKFSKEIYRVAGENLGIGIASAINLLNPEIIVFTGGISNANKFLEKPVRKMIYKRAFKKPAESLRIIWSKNANNLGAIGAGLLSSP